MDRCEKNPCVSLTSMNASIFFRCGREGAESIRFRGGEHGRVICDRGKVGGRSPFLKQRLASFNSLLLLEDLSRASRDEGDLGMDGGISASGEGTDLVDDASCHNVKRDVHLSWLFFLSKYRISHCSVALGLRSEGCRGSPDAGHRSPFFRIHRRSARRSKLAPQQGTETGSSMMVLVKGQENRLSCDGMQHRCSPKFFFS